MADFSNLFEELEIPVDNPDGLIDIPFDDPDTRIDTETLEALRAGSHNAYTRVFNLLHTPVRMFLAKMLRDDQDAQEMTQEVFFQLWIKHEQIDPHKNIKGFLYSTARYYMLNYFRHKKVVFKYEQYLSDNGTVEQSPYEHYAAKELNLLAEIAIARMPSQQRTVFRMRYEECKSNEEIAELLNCRPETVRVHLSRGKRDIKDILLTIATFLMVP